MATSPRELHIKPEVCLQAAIKYATELFGLELSKDQQAEELCSYHDRNFLLKGKLPRAQENSMYVLKIMNSMDTYNPELIDGMDAAMIHFKNRSKEFLCPQPIKSLAGKRRHEVEIAIRDPIKTFITYFNGQENVSVAKIKEIALNIPFVCIKSSNGDDVFYMTHYVRLLSYIPGRTLSAMKVISNDVLRDCGVMIAKVQDALKDFYHPALADRKHLWDTLRAGDVMPLLDKVQSLEKSDKDMIRSILENFEKRTVPHLSLLPSQTIHSDLNWDNIILRVKHEGLSITGIIDFGNITYGCKLLDIGISACYLSLARSHSPLTVVQCLLDGYQSIVPLTENEIRLIYGIMVARMAQSVTIGYYSKDHRGWGEEYVLKDARVLLKILPAIVSAIDI